MENRKCWLCELAMADDACATQRDGRWAHILCILAFWQDPDGWGAEKARIHERAASLQVRR